MSKGTPKEHVLSPPENQPVTLGWDWLRMVIQKTGCRKAQVANK